MCYLFVLSFSPTTHATIYSVRTDFHCVTVFLHIIVALHVNFLARL